MIFSSLLFLVFVLQFSHSQDVWMNIAVNGTAPLPRYWANGVLYSKFMYIYGGSNSSGGAFLDIHKFDVSSKRWINFSVGGTFPGVYGLSTSVVYQNYMYVFGGQNLIGLNEIAKYDLSSDSWLGISAKGTPPSGRVGHSAVVYGNYMYIFGGISFMSYAGQTFNDIAKYDFTNDSWVNVTVKGTPPAARYGHSAIVYGTYMYIYGGSNNAYPLPNYFNDVHKYDLVADSWVAINVGGSIPSGRYFHSAVVYANFMFIFAGYDGVGFLNDVARYDCSNDSWVVETVKGTPPSPRYGQSSVLYNNQMYIFGGLTSNGDSNHIYDLSIYAQEVTTGQMTQFTMSSSAIMTYSFFLVICTFFFLLI